MNEPARTMNLKYTVPIKSLLVVALLMAAQPVLSQQPKGQVLDKIVSKVDNYIVLKSEVDRTYLEYLSRGEKGGTAIKCKIMENLVIDKLMVAKAEIDSVIVSDEEVESNLDRRLQIMISQIGSEEDIERYYGKSIEQFKEELRESIHEQLVVQRMESEITADLEVTPAEVKKFFKRIPRDSLPFYSKEIEIAQIVKYPSISKSQREKVKKRLYDIRADIMAGADFEDMARKHSEDAGSAARGGNYGFKKRGQFVPEYEAVVFKLKAGEISEPVESDYGYHLIQLIERRGNEYNSRHILLMTNPSESDLAESGKYLDSLRTLIVQDSISFEKAATEYSDDIETAGSGGFLLNNSGGSRVPVDEIDPVIFFTIDTMQVGTISNPIAFRTPDGKDAVRILYYKSTIKPHLANLQQDYQKIYAAALNKKRLITLNDWFDEAKEDVFIEIDPEFRECRILNIEQ